MAELVGLLGERAGYSSSDGPSSGSSESLRIGRIPARLFPAWISGTLLRAERILARFFSTRSLPARPLRVEPILADLLRLGPLRAIRVLSGTFPARPLLAVSLVDLLGLAPIRPLPADFLLAWLAVAWVSSVLFRPRDILVDLLLVGLSARDPVVSPSAETSSFLTRLPDDGEYTHTPPHIPILGGLLDDLLLDDLIPTCPPSADLLLAGLLGDLLLARPSPADLLLAGLLDDLLLPCRLPVGLLLVGLLGDLLLARPPPADLVRLVCRFPPDRPLSGLLPA